MQKIIKILGNSSQKFVKQRFGPSLAPFGPKNLKQDLSLKTHVPQF